MGSSRCKQLLASSFAIKEERNGILGEEYDVKEGPYFTI